MARFDRSDAENDVIRKIEREEEEYWRSFEQTGEKIRALEKEWLDYLTNFGEHIAGKMYEEAAFFKLEPRSGPGLSLKWTFRDGKPGAMPWEIKEDFMEFYVFPGEAWYFRAHSHRHPYNGENEDEKVWHFSSRKELEAQYSSIFEWLYRRYR